MILLIVSTPHECSSGLDAALTVSRVKLLSKLQLTKPDLKGHRGHGHTDNGRRTGVLFLVSNEDLVGQRLAQIQSV